MIDSTFLNAEYSRGYLAITLIRDMNNKFCEKERGASMQIIILSALRNKPNNALLCIQISKLQVAFKNEFNFIFATASFPLVPVKDGKMPAHMHPLSAYSGVLVAFSKALVATLHLYGRQDFALRGSRKLVAMHFTSQNAHTCGWVSRPTSFPK